MIDLVYLASAIEIPAECPIYGAKLQRKTAKPADGRLPIRGVALGKTPLSDNLPTVRGSRRLPVVIRNDERRGANHQRPPRPQRGGGTPIKVQYP